MLLRDSKQQNFLLRPTFVGDIFEKKYIFTIRNSNKGPSNLLGIYQAHVFLANQS